MLRFSFLLIFLSAACLTLQGQQPEKHYTEIGSSAIFQRSAFAHGYRHGYEEGYHLGNIDINLGRLARPGKKMFHGLPLGYASEFGSKKLFQSGFEAGVKAGYYDGFNGKNFRVVESLRSASVALDSNSSSLDPSNSQFDEGLFVGYGDGFISGQSVRPSTSMGPLDFHSVGCSQTVRAVTSSVPAHGGYCEGYQRGFVLGHADSLALESNHRDLEASR